jgi:metal iron transporter
MGRPKIEPTSSWESDEKRGREALVVETTISGPEYQRPQASYSLWNIIKRSILARQPTEGAPLEHGGNREPEEPANGILGVLLKFTRFLGPGMIVTVAFIDPDNFQSNVQVGQDFQYKMLFVIFLSLFIAMYLQVGSPHYS